MEEGRLRNLYIGLPAISPCAPFVPATHLAAASLTTKCNVKTILGTLRATDTAENSHFIYLKIPDYKPRQAMIDNQIGLFYVRKQEIQKYIFKIELDKVIANVFKGQQ